MKDPSNTSYVGYNKDPMQKRIPYNYLNVSIEDRLRVVRPVLMTLLPPLLHAPGQHHDGSAVGLPAHPPEVVPGGVQRTLGHDELSLGVEAWDEVSIDVVAAILIISRL